MDKINKHYTESFVLDMNSRIERGEISRTEVISLRDRLAETIEDKYSYAFHCMGMGIFQTERQFVNHVWNSMNTLKLEYTDLNIFVAAAAMSIVVQKKYGGMGAFCRIPNIAQYGTAAGTADVMNKIVAFYNGE